MIIIIHCLVYIRCRIKYANEQLAIDYNTEFYKMIAWSVIKIGEKDIEIYNELIEELLICLI